MPISPLQPALPAPRRPRPGTARLADAIEMGISQQGGRAGLRLRSQRDIALDLGVTRAAIRSAMDVLVRRGVLVRKGGSGVYVRKTARAGGPTPEGGSEGSLPSGTRLFAEEPEPSTRLRPEPSQTTLRIGLWWHKPRPQPSGDAFLEGVAAQMRELGHELSVQIDRDMQSVVPHFIDHLRQAQRENHFDGHVILATFAEAYFDQPPEMRAPAIFLYMGSSDIFPPTVQPLVSVDLEAACRKAIQVFQGEGLRRIAFLGLDVPDESFDERFAQRGHIEIGFARLLAEAGLELCGVPEFAGLNDASAHAAIRRILDMAPDALYIADDHILAFAARALAREGIVPGRDLPVITLSTDGSRLPRGADWSRLHFNLSQLGRLAAQSLVRNIQSHGETLLSFSHQPHWIPGKTHRR